MRTRFTNPFGRKHLEGISQLASALRASAHTEHLDDMPARFARVIDAYNAIDVDPRFRHDVFDILDSALDLANAVVEPNYPVETASQAVASLLAILAKLTMHLQNTPKTTGFAILIPERNHLIGNYSTETEAQNQLLQLRAMGASANAHIVPTTIKSLHAIQPKPTDQSPAHVEAPSTFTPDTPTEPNDAFDDPIELGPQPEEAPPTAPAPQAVLKPSALAPIAPLETYSPLTERLSQAAPNHPKD